MRLVTDVLSTVKGLELVRNAKHKKMLVQIITVTLELPRGVEGGLLVPSSNTGVLPVKCIICSKEQQFVTRQGKRVKDKLQLAETFDAGI